MKYIHIHGKSSWCHKHYIDNLSYKHKILRLKKQNMTLFWDEGSSHSGLFGKYIIGMS